MSLTVKGDITSHSVIDHVLLAQAAAWAQLTFIRLTMSNSPAQANARPVCSQDEREAPERFAFWIVKIIGMVRPLMV
jgi:hypothetical protein